MALDEKRKDRLRHVIRVTMVAIASLLLFFALIIPVANNAVALGVEKDLKSIPVPAHTEIVESISVAGKLAGNGNGMQYFGAVLLKSDLTLEELQTYYFPHRQGTLGCMVEPQATAAICPGGNPLSGAPDLTFREPVCGEGYYILYTWGSVPAWLHDLLNTDMRGH